MGGGEELNFNVRAEIDNHWNEKFTGRVQRQIQDGRRKRVSSSEDRWIVVN